MASAADHTSAFIVRTRSLVIGPMQSKTDLFPPDLARLAEQAQALSHPARLAILQVLARRGTCICGDLVSELPLAQATVSQHLKTLKASGLIRGEVDGPRSCYCLDSMALDRLVGDFGALIAPIAAAARAADLACDDDCC
jgi:ArsR family transcriptional regulator